MKKLSFLLVLMGAFFITKAQFFRDAQKRTETFSADDALVKTIDMDLTSGLAQIGYIRPAVNSLVNTPSNSNTATRIQFTHLDNFSAPNVLINKVMLPKTENPNYLDDNKKYYPTEIHKISQGYIVCGYYEDVAACSPSAAKNAFMMKLDNNGDPINYKAYTITGNVNDYIVLNSVAAVNDGSVTHGFVACGYKWDNTNQRKKAIIVVVDENLNLLNTKEVNEAAIFVSELSKNVFPDSYYSRIDRYTNDELFLVGANGVVSVPESSVPDGKAYLRADVLFARCSTDVTIRPSTPLIVTSVNLFSNFTDVPELGVALVQGSSFQNGADYILLTDRVDDQFSGSTFLSRNATILLHAIGSVHSVNYSTWVNGGVTGRFDYQNTIYERGVDIIVDDSNHLFILCSYDGYKKPIESQVIMAGGNPSIGRGDDYMGGFGGDLVPRDLDKDGANGRKILTHYEVTSRAEKINPLNYTSTPFPIQCKSTEHNVANYTYSVNKGTSKTYQTPAITACFVDMKSYQIPISISDPCPPEMNRQNGSSIGKANPNEATATNTNSTQTGIKVYPNPAANTVTFAFTDAVPTAAKLEIIAVSGQVVMTLENADIKANDSNVAVDISSLADGTYFCKITGTDGVQVQTRFQKTTLK